jgi:hypothetical protein
MMLAVVPVVIDAGGGVLSVTEITGVVVMVMDAVADFVGSEADVAVIVTTPVPGTAEGAA